MSNALKRVSAESKEQKSEIAVTQRCRIPPVHSPGPSTLDVLKHLALFYVSKMYHCACMASQVSCAFQVDASSDIYYLYNSRYPTSLACVTLKRLRKGDIAVHAWQIKSILHVPGARKRRSSRRSGWRGRGRSRRLPQRCCSDRWTSKRRSWRCSGSAVGPFQFFGFCYHSDVVSTPNQCQECHWKPMIG